LATGLSGQEVLGFVSIFSSVATLCLVFQIGMEWGNKKSAFWAVQILACCFTFWRNACIIEVYNFALIFWAIFILGLLRYCKSEKDAPLWAMSLAYSIGLLVHIQFVLTIPFWIFLFIKRRPKTFWPFITFLIPILVVLYTVYVLKLNDLRSVFFDAAQEKMLDPGWINIAKGPFFIAAFSIILNPSLAIAFFIILIFDPKIFRLLRTDLFFQNMLWIAIAIFGFASLYPERGIHVFLLPGFLILSIIAGNVLSNLQWSYLFATIYPVVQIGIFLLFVQMYDSITKDKPDPGLALKGGSGYLFLPWAKGNASSILEVAQKYPMDSIPEELKWNFVQAKGYLKKNKLKH